MKSTVLSAWFEFLLPGVLLVVWWFTSANSSSFYFPPLQEIFVAFRESWLSARLTQDLVPSVVRLLTGFAIAIVVGVAGGVLFGLKRSLEGTVSAVLDFLRSMPSVALIPLAILVFGIGTSMKVFVIAFGAVWPILLNTIDGVKGADSQQIDMARSFRLGGGDTLWRVILPAASPQIFTGLRASLSISIIMMVVSEMLASTNGIGFAILQAQRSFAIKEMWAGIILLGIVGYVLNLLFILVERRVMHWHRNMRAVEDSSS
ncbi:ABC transporter permease [Eoetvoesiella caeni]